MVMKGEVKVDDSGMIHALHCLELREDHRHSHLMLHKFHLEFERTIIITLQEVYPVVYSTFRISLIAYQVLFLSIMPVMTLPNPPSPRIPAVIKSDLETVGGAFVATLRVSFGEEVGLQPNSLRQSCMTLV